MISFSEQFKPLILDGTKTQTRRTGRCRWKVGSVHKVTTNTRAPEAVFGSVRITSLRRDWLINITQASIKAEGFRTKQEFIEAFAKCYRISQRDARACRCWVITFELVEEEESPA